MGSDMFKSTSAALIVSAVLLGGVSDTQAASVAWTDWTLSIAGLVEGSLDVHGIPVDVRYFGNYGVAQTSGGTNYWDPVDPYLSSVVSNAPPASDVIFLGGAYGSTITFSRPVVDPLIALTGWNGNSAEFGRPIEILSFGAGYFGDGTPVLNDAGTGFVALGNVHGVIRVPGTFDSISFWHTDEDTGWFGITVGAVGLPVPEPSTYAMALVGLGLLGTFARRHRLAGHRPQRVLPG